MNYDSCVDAFNTFQETRTGNLTIGPRAQTAMTYSLQYDLQLPVRWISGDGRCIFDIVKRGPNLQTQATALEIQAAGVSLLNLCLKDGGGQGGIASGVGPSGDIGVILRPYTPRNVDCGNTGPGAFANDCDLMGQTMQAATAPLVRFGPKESPDTDVGLPFIWAMRPPRRCTRVLASEELGAWDTSTFFDLWQAFVAIKGMCVRYGRKGRMKGLGTGGKMWLIVNP
ncbi:hypothetical protein MMC28_004270 [Mycoblastus sanguinarius]|nr:hypothetical protein [Mycoblastus sanguinarius]